MRNNYFLFLVGKFVFDIFIKPFWVERNRVVIEIILSKAVTCVFMS